MKICVLGDVLIDRYWIGEVKGLSAEAPIPTILIQSKFDLPGGAGNLQANLEALGLEVDLLLPEFPQYPVKNRLMVGNRQVARWDEEDWCVALAKDDLWGLLDCNGVMVADYGKGSITPEIVEVLRSTTLSLFVDTKSDPSPWIGSEAYLFPNRKEWEQYEEAYKWISKVVLKRGVDGVALLEYGHPVLHRPSLVENPVSVCGAGDTVMATFGVGLLQGLPLDRCLELAMQAAKVVCEKPYTSVVSPEELLVGIS